MLHLIAATQFVVHDSDPTAGRVLRFAIAVTLLAISFIWLRRYRRRFGRKR